MSDKTEKISILEVLFLVLFICITIAFIYTYNYADSLTYEIRQRDNTIEILNSRDSIQQSIINARNNSNNSESISFSSGELVKYANEMSNTIDSLYNKIIGLHNEINNLNDSLRYYKIYYDYSQRKFNHIYTVKKNASGDNNYSFDSNAIIKDEYIKSQTKVNELTSQLFELNSTLRGYEQALKKYNIEVETVRTKIGNVTAISYKTEAIVLDSALMLLPVYRDKLKYNEKKNEWSIGGKMFIRYITVEKDSVE